jgi:hypothetical protein
VNAGSDGDGGGGIPSLLATQNDTSNASSNDTTSAALDSDGDGVSDVDEGKIGTDPYKPNIATTSQDSSLIPELSKRLRDLTSTFNILKSKTVANTSTQHTTTSCMTDTFTEYYNLGDSGPQVRKIQQFLKKQGFYNHSIFTDYYGPVTQKAVKAFQTKYADEILASWHLTKPSGWWYKSSVKKANQLSNTCTPSIEEEPTPIAKTSLDVSECPHFTTYYKKGDQNQAELKKIQIFLKDQGVFSAEPTGYYGPLTDKAIRAFQAKYPDEILKPWKLAKPTGWWYKTTRKKANELTGCSVNTVLR